MLLSWALRTIFQRPFTLTQKAESKSFFSRWQCHFRVNYQRHWDCIHLPYQSWAAAETLNCNNKALVLAGFRDNRCIPSDNPRITVQGVRRAMSVTSLSSQQVASEAHYRKLALSFSDATGDSRGKELFSLPVGLAACRKQHERVCQLKPGLITRQELRRATLVRPVQWHKHHKEHAQRHLNHWCCNLKMQNVFMATTCQGTLKEPVEEQGVIRAGLHSQQKSFFWYRLLYYCSPTVP